MMTPPGEDQTTQFWVDRPSAERAYRSPSTDDDMSGRKQSEASVFTPDTERTSISESSDRIVEVEETSPTVQGRGKPNSRHRRSHIKSKKGCFSCKDRRVKCDEHQPACRNCLRRAIPCEYPPPPAAPEIVFTQPFVPDQNKNTRKDYSKAAVTIIDRNAKLSNKSDKPCKDVVIKKERVVEQLIGLDDSIPAEIVLPDLSLMQNFSLNACKTIVLGANSTLWQKGIASEALKYDFLMHSLLMFSAGHLAHRDPLEPSYNYLELYHRQQALVTLRQALSTTGVGDNADALLGASALLAFHSCATYDDDNLDFSSEHYLILMNGIRLIGKAMWGRRRQSLFGQLLSVPFAMPPDKEFLFGLDEVFPEDVNAKPIRVETEVPWVAEPLSAGRENLDAFIYDNDTTYFKVLCTLMPMIKAVIFTPDGTALQPKSLLLCALLAWPAMLPNKYVRLTKHNDKKALLIMAYYYATLHKMDLSGVWWMRGRPLVMCRALCKMLADEYRPYLSWPADVIGYSFPEDGFSYPQINDSILYV